MSFIGVVSDSTAGLSTEYVERHKIHIVPLYVKMGEQTYRDGVDIQPDEFYERLPKCDPLPTTSQPSAGDFAQAYRRAADAGAEGIISVHISSGISGTVNSAQLAAKEMGDLPVEVVDTRYASAVHLFAVEATVSALEGGASLKEAADAARRVVDVGKLIFVVDTLEYLYKGGRIGGAAGP